MKPGRVGRAAHGGVLELIGNTPMVVLGKMTPPRGAAVWGKLESLNPGGSIKDRIALGMVLDAEEKGLLKPGGTIVEPTSGNTGIGLAIVAAARGYDLILTMPETMSIERRNLLKAFGVEVVLTPGAEGMRGSIDKAEEIVRGNSGCFMPQQFENPSNPEVHRRTTAVEILEQTRGEVHAFVAGVGTGGTITGVGGFLKERLPGVQVVAVEPASSPVLSGGRPGPHKIQGLGPNFVPPVLDKTLIDQVIRVSDTDAYLTMCRLYREEGLLLGISSGAAVYGAIQVSERLGPGKRVVAILADTGERYLSLIPYFKLDA